MAVSHSPTPGDRDNPIRGGGARTSPLAPLRSVLFDERNHIVRLGPGDLHDGTRVSRNRSESTTVLENVHRHPHPDHRPRPIDGLHASVTVQHGPPVHGWPGTLEPA